MAGELLQYKVKLQDQEKKANDAEEARVAAQDAFNELTATDSSPFPAETTERGQLSSMAAELNKYLSKRLANLPADESQDILSGLSDIVRKTAASAAAAPPPYSFSLVAGSSSGGVGGGSRNSSYDAAQLALHEEKASLLWETLMNVWTPPGNALPKSRAPGMMSSTVRVMSGLVLPGSGMLLTKPHQLNRLGKLKVWLRQLPKVLLYNPRLLSQPTRARPNQRTETRRVRAPMRVLVLCLVLLVHLAAVQAGEMGVEEMGREEGRRDLVGGSLVGSMGSPKGPSPHSLSLHAPAYRKPYAILFALGWTSGSSYWRGRRGQLEPRPRSIHCHDCNSSAIRMAIAVC